MRIIVGLLLVLFAQKIWSQTHEWWAENVGWDGVTSWQDYLVFSPGSMGPNALPVPSFSDGIIDSIHQISIAHQFTFRNGERTHALILEGQYVPIPNRLGFKIYWMPVEWFNTAHFLKTTRKVFHENYHAKKAGGDVYFETDHVLYKRDKSAANLRLGYKFAASSQLGAARFTDTPGYYFDLSFVRYFRPSNFTTLEVATMTGLYIWHTNNSPIHRQNDAFLYSIQLKLKRKTATFRMGVGGYIGYLNNGDQPHVLDIAYQLVWPSLWGLQVNGRSGLNKDWPFASIALKLIKKIRS